MTLDATLQYSSTPPSTAVHYKQLQINNEYLRKLGCRCRRRHCIIQSGRSSPRSVGRRGKDKLTLGSNPPARGVNGRAGRPARRLAVQQAATTAAQRAAAHFPGRGRLFVGRGKWKRADDTATEWLNATELLIIPPESADPTTPQCHLGHPAKLDSKRSG